VILLKVTHKYRLDSLKCWSSEWGFALQVLAWKELQTRAFLVLNVLNLFICLPNVIKHAKNLTVSVSCKSSTTRCSWGCSQSIKEAYIHMRDNGPYCKTYPGFLQQHWPRTQRNLWANYRSSINRRLWPML